MQGRIADCAGGVLHVVHDSFAHRGHRDAETGNLGGTTRGWVAWCHTRTGVLSSALPECAGAGWRTSRPVCGRQGGAKPGQSPQTL